MMRVAVVLAVLAVWVLGALAAKQALAGHSQVAKSPAVKGVADEQWNRGVRGAYVYVSLRGREYTAAAGSGAPRTRYDRVRIGNVSETFAAAIILQLAEEGKLHLDDSLVRYVHGVRALGHRITL